MNISIGGNNGINSMTRNQRLAWGTVLIIIGIAISGLGYIDYQSQGDALQNAVNVTGTVTGTEIVTDSGGRRSSPDHSPVISFNYSYNGQSYSSDNTYPPGDTQRELNSRSAAEKIAQNYSTGTTVTAYVNPENPGEAFLKKKRSNDPVIFMGIGAVVILGGLYVILKP
jgi:hypothetical protein